MSRVKRAAAMASQTHISPGRKGTDKVKAESPPASKGLELEIGHPPEPQTPPRKRVKTEPKTPITPSKVKELAKESPSKMSPAKLRVLESLGASPFADFAHPTHEECQTVNTALVKEHGNRVRP